VPIRGLLVDIVGVLYTGDTAVPGARGALSAVMEAGLPVRFVTNTTRSPKRTIVSRLRRMGFPIDEHQVFTAPQAVHAYLKAHEVSPYLLVHPALEEEFADLPRRAPNAVVIGDAGERFTYAALNAAFRLLMEGVPLLAIANNRYFREDGGLSLDAGPFVAALENAAGVTAMLFGKPARSFFAAALADLGMRAEEALMIGDDVEADVNGALAVGMRAALVRTGKYRPRDEARLGEGGIAADDLAALLGQISFDPPLRTW
jgi:HAD superfamily hydrolase (TIGR01458 family)